MEIGKKVIYHDGNGAEHEALVTLVHDGQDPTRPHVNLVYASPDDHAIDEYGRQLERRTLVPIEHKNSESEGRPFWSEV